MKDLKAFINKDVIKRIRHNIHLKKERLDKKLLNHFGCAVEIRNGTHWITLGDSGVEPFYVEELRDMIKITYDEELGYPLMIMVTDISIYGWAFIEIGDYKKTFPRYDGNDEFDIVAIYKLPIEPKDIDTLDGLKEVYKKYNLNQPSE